MSSERSVPGPLDPDRGSDPIVRVRGMKKYYPVTTGILNRHVGDVKAVDGVEFDLYPGQTLAVVGESGCGKSTLAETVLGLENATAGSVFFRDRDLTTLSTRDLRSLRMDLAMIFQDPFSSLNERMSVGGIVREPMEIHDVYEGERNARVADLLDRVGLDPHDHFDRFPHELSGGQRQRVSIARALALNPSVVVADEPVSALDVSVQAQILTLLSDLQDEFGLSYLFISHDLSVVRHIADHVGVMYLGRMVETADVETLFEDPTHPYTQALLSDVPRIDTRDESFAAIELEGSPPTPEDPPTGCNFHTRCHLKPQLTEAEQERCEVEDPTLGDQRGHCVACHFRQPSTDD